MVTTIGEARPSRRLHQRSRDPVRHVGDGCREEAGRGPACAIEPAERFVRCCPPRWRRGWRRRSAPTGGNYSIARRRSTATTRAPKEQGRRDGRRLRSGFPDDRGPADSRMGRRQYRSPPAATGALAQADPFDRPRPSPRRFSRIQQRGAQGVDGWIEADAATRGYRKAIPVGSSAPAMIRAARPSTTMRPASLRCPQPSGRNAASSSSRRAPGPARRNGSKASARPAIGRRYGRSTRAISSNGWNNRSPARMWFAEKLDMPTAGFETLDACWQRWAAASEPAMKPAIFEPSLAAYRDVFKEWLEKPSDRPFMVAADSKGEALAFLACLFEDDEIPMRWRDLAAVFESGEVLRKLRDVECVVPPHRPYRRGRTRTGLRLPSTSLHRRSPPQRRRFQARYRARPAGLQSLRDGSGRDGCRERRCRSAREGGRDGPPTILRRRLSKVPAIRTPRMGRRCRDRAKPDPDDSGRGMARNVQCRSGSRPLLGKQQLRAGRRKHRAATATR